MKRTLLIAALLVAYPALSGAAHEHEHEHEHEHQEKHQHSDKAHNEKEMLHMDVHQHGVGELALMQQQQQLMISVTLPADTLWGFEYMPQNEQQQQAIDNALAVLAKGHSSFHFEGDANCTSLDTEVIKPAGLTNPEVTHMDVTANWLWQCDNVSAVEGLHTDIFDKLPRLERLESQILLDHANSGGVLSPNNRQLEWH